VHVFLETTNSNSDRENEINDTTEINNSNESDVIFSKSSSLKIDFNNPTAESILKAIILCPENFKEETPPKAVWDNRLLLKVLIMMVLCVMTTVHISKRRK